MYFTGLDMNIMTLAGLSLGIGMLVEMCIRDSAGCVVGAGHQQAVQQVDAAHRFTDAQVDGCLLYTSRCV